MAARTILVVDDLAGVTRFCAEFLRHEGYEVVEINNPLHALERVKAGGIDLVISDVNMPEMDGFTLIERIREQPEHRRLPVLILSAWDRVKGKQRSKLVGAVDFLPKPVLAADLLSKVKAALPPEELARPGAAGGTA